MSSPQPPPRENSHDPSLEDARASLREIDEVRRNAAEVSRLPMWFKFAFALVCGAIPGLLTLDTTTAGLTAIAFAVVGFAVLGTIHYFLRRRRGRPTGGRPSSKRVLVLFGFILSFNILVSWGPDSPDWQPWYAIGTTCIMATITYAFLQWDENFGTKALAEGDYDTSDLL